MNTKSPWAVDRLNISPDPQASSLDIPVETKNYIADVDAKFFLKNPGRRLFLRRPVSSERQDTSWIMSYLCNDLTVINLGIDNLPLSVLHDPEAEKVLENLGPVGEAFCVTLVKLFLITELTLEANKAPELSEIITYVNNFLASRKVGP